GDPLSAVLLHRTHSPHPHVVIRDGDRMLEREAGIGTVTASCFLVAQRFQRCDPACPIGPGFSPWGTSIHLRQFPHPRHQPRVPRPLHQKHFALAARQRVMNLPLLLPRHFRRARHLPARRAPLHHRTSQTCRCPRRAHGRSQFHHRLIEISRTCPIQQRLRCQPEFLPSQPLPRKPLQHPLHIPVHHRDRLTKNQYNISRTVVTPPPPILPARATPVRRRC